MPSPAFLADERGAVTVDWVLLTAGMVGLALSAVMAVKGGADVATSNIDTALNDPSIIVRMSAGFGYAPADRAAFDGFVSDLSALSEDDLAQVSAFASAAASQDLSEAPDEVRGRIADLNAAVDVAYAYAGQTRPAGTEYDAEALTRISGDLGLDTPADTVTGTAG